jgi:integrase
MASSPTRPRLISHHDARSWTSFWYDDGGNKRTKRFGKQREVTAKQAKALFDDWIQTSWKRHEHVRNPGSPSAVFTVSRLADHYLDFARTIYRKAGQETSHVLTIEYALGTLSRLYGDNPADSLSNPQLAKLRDAMIHDANGKARSIKTVNGRLHAIQQAYKWGREKGHVSAATLADVLAVSRLRRGRSAAKDPQLVQPIAQDIVDTTLVHCPPTLTAMIRLNWLTGMRPGEVCIIRPCDIETGGMAWLYHPYRHKLEHKEIDRVIPLGPQAQDIIRPFLTRDTQAYIFSPADAQRQRLEARQQARKTPEGYGNAPGTNRKEDPERTPGDCYTVESYRKAIHHACRAVERELRRADPEASFPTWNPNQLRHSWATRIRKEFGIEEASAGLGHSNLSTTEIYAKRSLDLSTDVALRVG